MEGCYDDHRPMMSDEGKMREIDSFSLTERRKAYNYLKSCYNGDEVKLFSVVVGKRQGSQSTA